MPQAVRAFRFPQRCKARFVKTVFREICREVADAFRHMCDSHVPAVRSCEIVAPQLSFRIRDSTSQRIAIEFDLPPP